MKETNYKNKILDRQTVKKQILAIEKGSKKLNVILATVIIHVHTSA